MFECTCGREFHVDPQHVWKIMTQANVQRMGLQVDTQDSDYFWETHRLIKHGSRRGILCPYCTGFTMLRVEGERVVCGYHLPEKEYPEYALLPPEHLQSFTCTCGACVNTSDLHNQWTMIPREELEIEQVYKVFDEMLGEAAYYKALYTIGKRLVTCPVCEGITAVKCDSLGNGQSAIYYAQKRRYTDLDVYPDGDFDVAGLTSL